MGGSSWLLADRVIRIVLGLAVNVAMARVLGPSDFGLFAYAATIAALFLPIGTLGLERIVVRELARGTVQESRMLGSVTLVRLGGGLIGCGLAVVVAWLTADESRALTAAMVAFIAGGQMLQAFDAIDWSFQAKANFRRGTVARLVAFVIASGLKLGLVFSGAGLMGLAVATFLEMLLSAIFQVGVWIQAGGKPADWKFDSGVAGTMLRLSSPLLIGELAIWIFQKADMMILQHWAASAEIGYYALAQRLGQAGFFLPVLAVQVFSPMVARVATETEALAVVQKVMNGLVLVAYGIALVLSLASSFLIRRMFGPAFEPAALLLAWLAWSNLFVFMGCAHSLYLVNRDAQKISLRLAWMTAVTSLALNFILVPRLHALGSVLANVGAYAFTTVFGVALYRRSRPLLAVNLRALIFPLAMLVPRQRAVARDPS